MASWADHGKEKASSRFGASRASFLRCEWLENQGESSEGCSQTLQRFANTSATGQPVDEPSILNPMHNQWRSSLLEFSFFSIFSAAGKSLHFEVGELVALWATFENTKIGFMCLDVPVIPFGPKVANSRWETRALCVLHKPKRLHACISLAGGCLSSLPTLRCPLSETMAYLEVNYI